MKKRLGKVEITASDKDFINGPAIVLPPGMLTNSALIRVWDVIFSA